MCVRVCLEAGVCVRVCLEAGVCVRVFGGWCVCVSVFGDWQEKTISEKDGDAHLGFLLTQFLFYCTMKCWQFSDPTH